MSKSIGEHTDQKIRNVIDNHRAKGKVKEPYYIAALQELAHRKGRGLSFQKSLEIIRQAALDKRFISYKELAEGSGAQWSRVRYAMNGHLGDLLDFAHGNGWPLLSAIVVNRQNLESGEMEPATLKGFVEAARRLGYIVDDEAQFLREQQTRVFDWLSASAAEPLSPPDRLSSSQNLAAPNPRG